MADACSLEARVLGVGWRIPGDTEVSLASSSGPDPREYAANIDSPYGNPTDSRSAADASGHLGETLSTGPDETNSAPRLVHDAYCRRHYPRPLSPIVTISRPTARGLPCYHCPHGTIASHPRRR